MATFPAAPRDSLIVALDVPERAAAEALRTFPIVNASIEGTNIIYHNEVNVGIAVALEGGYGLIVPVIRNADEKNVVGLQRSIVDLANRALQAVEAR